MSSILEDLFYGNVVGQSQYFKRDSRYGELSGQLAEKEDALLVHLNEAEKDLYDEVATAYIALIDCSEFRHFQRGFSLAAALFRELSQQNFNPDY